MHLPAAHPSPPPARLAGVAADPFSHPAGYPADRAVAHRATVSAIVPARNEAACIGTVVAALLAQRTATGEHLIAEVVVADNGSSDGTAQAAQAAGARVISVPQPGYGQACWHAVQASLGDVLLFVDGDGAASADQAHAVLACALSARADLVIGVRSHIEPGAMTRTQRFGNGLACLLMRSIWRMPAADLGPYRAIRRAAFDALDMQDRAFGWTVEMQVRAHVLGLRVAEVPVVWHARLAGVSKISGTWRGVLGAGVGILGMIACLWWRERARRLHNPQSNHFPAAPVHSAVLGDDARQF
jgi:glycosyltransferase involved in cell wall biosynthesis